MANVMHHGLFDLSSLGKAINPKHTFTQCNFTGKTFL